MNVSCYISIHSCKGVKYQQCQISKPPFQKYGYCYSGKCNVVPDHRLIQKCENKDEDSYTGTDCKFPILKKGLFICSS